jgi:hypothetical protein
MLPGTAAARVVREFPLHGAARFAPPPWADAIRLAPPLALLVPPPPPAVDAGGIEITAPTARPDRPVPIADTPTRPHARESLSAAFHKFLCY